MLLFASLDSGPGQVFTGTGVKYAPFGPLDASGFRILARAGSAQWRDPRVDGVSEAKAEGYLLLGGDQMTGRGSISIYLGPEIAASWPGASVTAKRKTHAASANLTQGLRIQAELWDHPTPETLVQLSSSISSARGEIWGRAALGYKLSELHPQLDGFIGPEAEATLASNYSKWRIGAHLTAFRLFNMHWRISAGQEQASDRQRGLYVAGGLHWTK